MNKSFEPTGTGAGSFGDHLRREREVRGISLDEIAAATKISKRFLRALEEEQFDLLPGGIFNKGYVRAYAKHVGINEEQAVAEYLVAADVKPPDVRLITHQNTSARTTDQSWTRYSGVPYRSGFQLIPVVILVLVIAGAVGGWHLYRQRQQEGLRSKKGAEMSAGPGSVGQPTSNSKGNRAPKQAGSLSSAASEKIGGLQGDSTSPARTAVQTVQAAESSTTLPKSSPSSTLSSSGSESGAQFEVTARAKSHARVEIKSDGRVLFKGVMNPAEVKTIRATGKVVFWTANAGEVELSFNGKNVPLDSGENDEQVVIFTSRGLLPRLATQ